MRVTVACTQMQCSWDIEANVARAEALVHLRKRYEGLRRRIQQFDAQDVFQSFVNAYTLSLEPRQADGIYVIRTIAPRSIHAKLIRTFVVLLRSLTEQVSQSV